MGSRFKHTFYETLDRSALRDMPRSDYDLCIRRLDKILDSRLKRCHCCGSTEIAKKGFSKNGTQRYACKVCGKGFLANVFPYSHVDIDRWKLFCRLFMEGTSIRHCATVCDICLKTSQHMKDRLVDMLLSDPSLSVTFCGEMMVDM